jgi:hypothetical protein
MTREPEDSNDYERKQDELLSYDGPSGNEEQGSGRDLDDDESRAANRTGLFDLKYPARCDRCGRSLPVGTHVIGRKLDEKWIIEEVDRCPTKRP